MELLIPTSINHLEEVKEDADGVIRKSSDFIISSPVVQVQMGKLALERPIVRVFLLKLQLEKYGK